MLKKSRPSDEHTHSLPSAKKLLAWYAKNGRVLPWRGVKGPHADYKIWLSEIMLQQTTVATVTPYYQDFIDRWPRLRDLASSSLDDVLQAWSGLGYYARARNLHKCAKIICHEYGGKFPHEEDELLTLPGIGPYTAAALSAILADKKTVVIDGNVERVISRIFTIEAPLPKAKPEIKRKAALLTPNVSTGDYAQALMDLGATICTPRNPKCDLCPWGQTCLAKKKNCQEEFPRKKKKAPKPKRYGSVFWVEDQDGNILLQKRPQRGIFGGMWVIPGTDWDKKSAEKKPGSEEVKKFAPLEGHWVKSDYSVRHVFTHFNLELDIWIGSPRESKPGDAFMWVAAGDISSVGLPSAMKKVAALMLQERPHPPDTPPSIKV